MSDDETHNNFEQGGADSADAFPLQCSALRKGGHVVIKGRPCKIVEMTTSKTGKHGHAKVHIVAIDIFTGKKYEEICPSTHNIMVPKVERSEHQLLNIDDDGFVSISMPVSKGGNSTGTKDDVRLPEGELGDKIRQLFEDGATLTLTVVSSMGDESIQGYKDST